MSSKTRISKTIQHWIKMATTFNFNMYKRACYSCFLLTNLIYCYSIATTKLSRGGDKKL